MDSDYAEMDASPNVSPVKIAHTFGLFFATAIAEILGCFFPYLILNKGKTPLYWIPTALSLLVFVYLLTLHPSASGRIYAAYGGIYITTALMWLYFVDHVSLSLWDIAGGALVLAGASVIILQPNGVIQ